MGKNVCARLRCVDRLLWGDSQLPLPKAAQGEGADWVCGFGARSDAAPR